jgi:hypothetical protein
MKKSNNKKKKHPYNEPSTHTKMIHHADQKSEKSASKHTKNSKHEALKK